MNRLEKPEWCPLEIVQVFLEAISNIHQYLFMQFAREYIPLIWSRVSTNLMNPTELNLRTYEKDRIENIINSIEPILLRAYSVAEKICFSENLTLALSVKCYKSEVLKQRITGLKLIS